MAYLIELVLGKTKKGIQAISLVKSPAILTNFIALAKDPMEKSMKLAVDTDKHIVLGPALIPNVKIFRSAKSLGLEQDAYVYFTAETIKEISEIYLATLKNNEVTLDHEEDTDDVKMIESWIVEDSEKDKSALYGFDLPVGTWCVAFKIQNEDLWKQIKDGDLQGFSIEADALTMIPKGEFSFAQEEDHRELMTDELATKFVNHLKTVGTKSKILDDLGFKIISQRIINDDIDEGLEDDVALLLAIESNPNEPSKWDQVINNNLYLVRYKYVGPRDEKNRKFCADVLDADLIYRKEDIDMMSFRGENPMSKQNYSIWKYKGSYNCRHRFERQIFMAQDYEEKIKEINTKMSSLNELSIFINEQNTMNSPSISKMQKICDDRIKEIQDALANLKKDDIFVPSNIVNKPSKLELPNNEEEATKVNSKVVKLAYDSKNEPVFEDIYALLNSSDAIETKAFDFSKKVDDKAFTEIIVDSNSLKNNILEDLFKITKY